MAHGLIRGSFVPDAHTQELRALLRTRKQFVRERSSHIQRLQKTLEDANIEIENANPYDGFLRRNDNRFECLRWPGAAACQDKPMTQRCRNRRRHPRAATARRGLAQRRRFAVLRGGTGETPRPHTKVAGLRCGR